LIPLLDTHVLLWWFEGRDRLSDDQRRALSAASPEHPLYLSEISLWEVATLLDLGRIRLSLPLRDWLERATAPPLVQRYGISPAVAAEVTSLPRHFHRDPADRIIVATARIVGATILTCDRRIIEAGIVPTLS
jgi:PIN domain nuclease of toxin-antitoxin system